MIPPTIICLFQNHPIKDCSIELVWVFLIAHAIKLNIFNHHRTGTAAAIADARCTVPGMVLF